MSDVSRREFLRRASQAGLVVGLGAQFAGLTGCGGDANSVEQPSASGYDAIIAVPPIAALVGPPASMMRMRFWPPPAA
jgi:hypothetical protein